MQVVVTGMGIVSPLGNDLETFWNALISGCSGVTMLDDRYRSQLKCHFAGQVPDLKPETFFTKKQLRRMDRFCQFAAIAAKKACLKTVTHMPYQIHLDLIWQQRSSGDKKMEKLTQQAIKIITRELDVLPKSITDRTSIQEDLGADSLDIINIVMAIENKFNVEINGDMLML